VIALLPSRAGSAHGQEPPIMHSPREVQDYENQLNHGRGLDPDGRQVLASKEQAWKRPRWTKVAECGRKQAKESRRVSDKAMLSAVRTER